MPIAPWSETAPRLVDVATGRAPADLVVRNGKWVNVHSGEVIPDTDIAIAEGRFAYCGPDASHCIGPETEVVEAQGRYLVPGLCDGHMHVESGMVTVTEFCRAVAPHGSTSLFIDPHEIANVLGAAGVLGRELGRHDERVELIRARVDDELDHRVDGLLAVGAQGHHDRQLTLELHAGLEERGSREHVLEVGVDRACRSDAL